MMELAKVCTWLLDMFKSFKTLIYVAIIIVTVIVYIFFVIF